jgi:hypothetical protein
MLPSLFIMLPSLFFRHQEVLWLRIPIEPATI